MPKAFLTLRNEGAAIKHPQLNQFLKENFPIAGTKSKKESFAESVEGGLAVTEEQLYRAPFRLLSENIVAPGTWRATDFSKQGVLKRSMPMLKGKPAYKDHIAITDEAIGVIEDVSYQSKTTNENGEEIPPGINGVFLIDGLENRNVVRLLQFDPPAINASSVTVEFNWKKSHNLEDDDFIRFMGEEREGEMVRRIATEIIAYYEGSLVMAGADPYARILGDDGKVKSLSLSDKWEKASQEEANLYTNSKKYFANFQLSQDCLYLKSTKGQNQNHNTMDKELQNLLLELTGAEKIEDVTLDQFLKVTGAASKDKVTLTSKDEIDKLKSKAGKEGLTAEEKQKLDQYDQLKQEKEQAEKDKQSAESKKQELESEKQKLEGKAQIADNMLKAKRDKVKHLHKLNNNNELPESMEKLIDEATNEQLDGLLANNGQKIGEEFRATCNKCGETDISFQSSFTNDPNYKGGGDKGEGENNDPYQMAEELIES